MLDIEQYVKVLFLIVYLLATIILVSKIISSIFNLIFQMVFIKRGIVDLKQIKNLVGIKFKSKFEIIIFVTLTSGLCVFVIFYIYYFINSIRVHNISYSDAYKLGPINQWLFYMLKDLIN